MDKRGEKAYGKQCYNPITMLTIRLPTKVIYGWDMELFPILKKQFQKISCNYKNQF